MSQETLLKRINLITTFGRKGMNHLNNLFSKITRTKISLKLFSISLIALFISFGCENEKNESIEYN